MPRLSDPISTPDATPSMARAFAAFAPKPYVTATPHPDGNADAPLLQHARQRVGAAQLPELLGCCPTWRRRTNAPWNACKKRNSSRPWRWPMAIAPPATKPAST